MGEDLDYLLRRVLRYLDRNLGLGTLYYPGSGWHRVPLEILGSERVYHLSKEELKGHPGCNPEIYGEEYRPLFENGYFAKLGSDAIHKKVGDYRQTPFFEDGKFDSTLIWGIPNESAIEAIPEFRRVTKKGGLFIVRYVTNIGEIDDKISKALDMEVRRSNFHCGSSAISLYQNYDK